MNDLDRAQKKANRLAQLVSTGHCALLVQEMQNSVVGPESILPALAAAGNEVGLIAHVTEVVKAARANAVPVVHCTADGLPGGFGRSRNARLFGATQKSGARAVPMVDGSQPIAELGPEDGDIVFPRYHGLSPMSGSALDQVLRNSGITTVIVVGVSLNIAVQNLFFDAVNRSYQTVIVSDAVVGIPVAYGGQILENTLSLVATIVTSEELFQAWDGA
jgi:biuret amidohydrolase